MDDPRVLFAAERTLLAWNRSALALMGFGFLIERFGLVVHTVFEAGQPLERGLSFWVGIAFVVLGSASAAYATRQYRRVLDSLPDAAIPMGYQPRSAEIFNYAVALLGVALCAYLFSGLQT